MRPEHCPPTSVALVALVAGCAWKTPTIGKTLPAFVAGQFPPSLALLPEPEYQRRFPELKAITSSVVACGKRVNMEPSTMLTSA